jgi:hypothetical protein
MFKQVFANFSDVNLIVTGFFLFMIIFLATFLWTYFVQDKKFYQQLSQNFLKGDE